MKKLLLLPCLLLVGCGQKGPLYLPSGPPAGTPLPGATAPGAPAAGDEADKEKSTPAAAPTATAE